MADGTVSVAANSTAVTGTLTSFVAAEGDLLVIGADVGVVKSRDSTTGLTLKQPWAGASVTNSANWIVLPVGPSWWSQVSLNLRLAALLAKWEVVGPVKYDGYGSLAQRANYNGQPVGFSYLAVDPLPFTLYVKLANTGSASDWSPGQQIHQKADTTAASEAARDAAAASASSASSNAAATAADRAATQGYASTASDKAATATSAANSAQTSANNAAATLANAALKGDNADISRLRGINGAGIDFWASETAVTGQGTCDLSGVTTLKVGVTISGPITSFGTGAHRFKILRFANVGTLTHGSQLQLQGGANITTAAGDRATFVSDASGVGYVIGYSRADGTPLSYAGVPAVRYDTAQSLTAAQIAQALANLGLDNPSLRRQSFRNRIINGNLLINQRGFSGTVTLAAGAYGHDGVKAGSSGASYTFAGNANGGATIIGAGTATNTVQQVVEGPLYVTDATMTVSWEGNATFRSAQGTPSGAFSTGSTVQIDGRNKQSITLTGLTIGGNLTLEWDISNGKTLSFRQMEPGSVATPYEFRDDELRRCQRYYEKSYGPKTAPGTATQNGASAVLAAGLPSAAYLAGLSITFKETKAGTPTITLRSPSSGAVGKVMDYNNNADVNGSLSSVGDAGFLWFAQSAAAAAGYNLQAHWVAVAEL